MPEVDVTEVAKYQRWLILVILAQIILVIVAIVRAISVYGTPAAEELTAGDMLFLLMRLTVAIAGIVLLIMLMGALERPVLNRILAAIAQFFPLINLIVLLVVNQRATSTLRQAGYKVGLMGAKAK